MIHGVTGMGMQAQSCSDGQSPGSTCEMDHVSTACCFGVAIQCCAADRHSSVHMPITSREARDSCTNIGILRSGDRGGGFQQSTVSRILMSVCSVVPLPPKQCRPGCGTPYARRRPRGSLGGWHAGTPCKAATGTIGVDMIEPVLKHTVTQILGIPCADQKFVAYQGAENGSGPAFVEIVLKARPRWLISSCAPAFPKAPNSRLNAGSQSDKPLHCYPAGEELADANEHVLGVASSASQHHSYVAIFCSSGMS